MVPGLTALKTESKTETLNRTSHSQIGFLLIMAMACSLEEKITSYENREIRYFSVHLAISHRKFNQQSVAYIN